MKIILDTPKEVVIVKEIKKQLSEITVMEVTDNADMKSVKAFTQEMGILTLWEGAAYDAIGQWTDTDVINRVKELVNS